MLRSDFFPGKSLSGFQPASSVPPHFLTHDLGSVPLSLQVKDLVQFLLDFQGPDKQLNMDCPLVGHPLPSIYFRLDSPENTDGPSPVLDARVEFSQELATMFIQYVMKHRQS